MGNLAGIGLMGIALAAASLQSRNVLLPIVTDLATDSGFLKTLIGVGIWFALANALPDVATLGISIVILMTGIKYIA